MAYAVTSSIWILPPPFMSTVCREWESEKTVVVDLTFHCENDQKLKETVILPLIVAFHFPMVFHFYVVIFFFGVASWKEQAATFTLGPKVVAQ